MRVLFCGMCRRRLFRRRARPALRPRRSGPQWPTVAYYKQTTDSKPIYRMKVFLGFFSVALCLSALMPQAHAGHPLVTDDTGTQGRGNHQIELNSDQARGDGNKTRVAALTYSYGLTPDLDIFVNLPAGLASPSGLGDVSLGMKWLIWEKQGTSLALAPELIGATGDEEKGLGNGKPGLALTVLASHLAGKWGVHGNLGTSLNRYALPEDAHVNRRAVWRTSVAASYLFHPQWMLLAETGIAQNQSRASRTDPAFLLWGLVYSPHPDLDIDLGWKAGLNRAEARRQIGAGLTWRF